MNLFFDNKQNTICAPATPDAVSALSIIRLSGPDSFEIIQKIFKSSQKDFSKNAKAYQAYFGNIVEADGSLIDQVIVTAFRAPHSFTGEDSIEISCHGSSFIRSRIIQALLEAGASPAGPGEFSRRAFLNGKMDLAQTEAVADLIASQSAAAHRLAINQMRGGFSSELKQMRARLLELASLLELELDFSEEEVEFADREQLRQSLEALQKHCTRLCESFKLGNVIKNGIPVAIVGAVNVGKSTLLNAILGEERAIVSEQEGTTRDTVEDSITIDGLQFRFIDTAGLRATENVVEVQGVERSYEAIRSASMLILVLDPSRPESIWESLNKVTEAKNDELRQILIVFNKCEDKISKPIAISLNNSDLMQQYNKYVIENNIDVIKSIQTLVEQVFSYGMEKGLPISGAAVLSAKQKKGTEQLKHLLSASILPQIQDSTTTLLTNARHYQALCSTLQSLDRVSSALSQNLSGDLIAQDLRQALFHIGTITGEISTDEILGNIFSRFCIGK